MKVVLCNPSVGVETGKLWSSLAKQSSQTDELQVQ